MDYAAVPPLDEQLEEWQKECDENAQGANEYHAGGISVFTANRPIEFYAGTHSHEDYEFIMPLSDTFLSLCDGITVPTEKQKFTPFNPWQKHGSVETVLVQKAICIFIQKEKMEKISLEAFGCAEVWFENISFVPSNNLRLMLGMYIKEIASRRDTCEAMRLRLADMLIIEIIRCGHGAVGRANIESEKTLDDNNDNIRLAMDFLSRFDVKFSLEDAAATAGLSPYYFIRSFKRQTGLTPYQYYTQSKIERAKYLLNNKDLTITEVALEAGFTNPSRFSNIFRKSTGVSPTEYRAKEN